MPLFILSPWYNWSFVSELVGLGVVGVAFSLLARIFGESLTIHFPLALFIYFFIKVEISLHTLLSLFMPGLVHSGSVS